MTHIPIELWQIIISYTNSESQINIKLTCKHLYNNLLFDNDYLNMVRRKVQKSLSKNNVTTRHIIRYLIQKHNYSKTEIDSIINAIADDNKILKQNCEAHQLEMIEYSEMHMGCRICNYELHCESCFDSHNDSCNVDDDNIYYIYDTIKCKMCSEKIKAFVCRDCHNTPSYCRCQKNPYGYYKFEN